MTTLNQIHKCNICGNITEVINPSGGTLVCCGQNMEVLSDEAKAEMSHEKHIPIVTREGNTVKVVVGSIPHPMTPEHYIQFIEIITPNNTYRKTLKPEQTPEAEFTITEDILTVREYCNLHGLRKN